MTLSPFLVRYFESWCTFSVPMLRELWSPDATYIILGKQVLHGIASIEAYWRINAEQQRNVAWNVESELVTAASIAAVWHANFDRVDIGRHYWLDGLLWMDVRENRIIKFMECYARRETD